MDAWLRPKRKSLLRDLNVDRVDAVDKPATRRHFLTYKSEGAMKTSGAGTAQNDAFLFGARTVRKSVTADEIAHAWVSSYPGARAVLKGFYLNEPAVCVQTPDGFYKVACEFADGVVMFDVQNAEQTTPAAISRAIRKGTMAANPMRYPGGGYGGQMPTEPDGDKRGPADPFNFVPRTKDERKDDEDTDDDMDDESESEEERKRGRYRMAEGTRDLHSALPGREIE